MAGELKHASVGADLSQAEYENVDAHVLDGQAAGDVVIADGAAGLKRLPAGTPGQVLTTNGPGADPSWEAVASASGAAGGDLSGSYPNPTVNATHAGSTHANLPAGAQVNSVDIVTTTGAQALTNKTLTSPVINTGVTGTAIGTGAGQLAAGDHTHGGAIAAETVADAPSYGQADYYCYRDSTGAYHAVNLLSGAVADSHATDFLQVWNTLKTTMAAYNTTNNGALSGGRVKLGPHIFNVTAPLVATSRSAQIVGSGMWQGTIIQQNAQFSAGQAIVELGTSSDAAILQGLMLSDLQIRGRRGHLSQTIGRGLNTYVAESRVERVIVLETNDTGIVVDNPTAGTAYSMRFNDVHITNFGNDGVRTADGLEIAAGISDHDYVGIYINQGSEDADRGRHGIHISGGGTARFERCHVWFARGHGYYGASGGNLFFQDCISESNGQGGMFFTGTDGLTIIGGALYGNSQFVDLASSTLTTDGSATQNNLYMLNVDRFRVNGVYFFKGRAAPPNPAHNIVMDTCTHGIIADNTFNDATFRHIMLSDCSYVTAHDNIFGVGLTYAGGFDGDTPSVAILLEGSTSNCKIHDNIIKGVMRIEELASGWTGNYNEIYNNKLDGNLTVTLSGSGSRQWGNRDGTNTLLANRTTGGKGADVASANDLTLGQGQYFVITGTTQINGIATAGWDTGKPVTLEFAATPTVKHNTAASAGFASLALAGAADFSATAGDTLTAAYNGTVWREIGRAVI